MNFNGVTILVSARGRFRILVMLVFVSGFSQGMLLPLIAIILEQNGVSSSINGIHATSLYIGVLIASPFMEKPLRKIGYKPLILTGGALVFISLFFFTMWEALWFWFILRMMIGIGDHILHFGTQTWITATSEPKKRGRDIAIYGLFFSLGFTCGPLMTRLIEYSITLPFILSALLCMIVWSTMFFVRNELPQQDVSIETSGSSMKRFWLAFKIAWVAFLPPFGYGFLEATLHGNFPVYGIRIGHDVDTLSLIIPCFAAASLLSQIPLGAWSDRFGRRNVLLVIIGLGALTFFATGFVEQSVIGLFIFFAIAGLLVGSTYSLGLSYMTDLLPKDLLPAGNILCGIAFSLGSITGPLLGGIIIEHLPNFSFFHIITVMLFIVFIALIAKKESKKPELTLS